MSRFKNALTKYFVATPVETGEEEFLALAKWITTVEDGSEDESEDVSYYDGDGSKSIEVRGHKEAYTFTGTFDESDPAMALIAGMKRDFNNREVVLKIERANGEKIEGPAIVTDIKNDEGGGEAGEFPEFSCTITYSKAPVVTKKA